MSIRKAKSDEISNFLAENIDWKINNKKLQKTFIFKNFIHAFGFMTQVALISESQNHHPEWSNVYKTVDVHLTTHEAEGITEKDFLLAKAMDEIAAKL